MWATIAQRAERTLLAQTRRHENSCNKTTDGSRDIVRSERAVAETLLVYTEGKKNSCHLRATAHNISREPRDYVSLDQINRIVTHVWLTILARHMVLL
jgi:hypothetical protein